MNFKHLRILIKMHTGILGIEGENLSVTGRGNIFWGQTACNTHIAEQIPLATSHLKNRVLTI